MYTDGYRSALSVVAAFFETIEEEMTEEEMTGEEIAPLAFDTGGHMPPG